MSAWVHKCFGVGCETFEISGCQMDAIKEESATLKRKLEITKKVLDEMYDCGCVYGKCGDRLKVALARLMEMK